MKATADGRKMDILEQFVHKDFIKQELEFSRLYKYLDRYSGIGAGIFRRSDAKKSGSIKENHTIWIYWKQGLEDAPRLVQKCYESVCIYSPQDFEVVFLTDRNLDQYIELPDYVWDKYEKGYFITAHLADMIRLELLCTYGGCWIDATVFCSGQIPWYMLTGSMFMFKLPSVLSDPVLKMSSWWIASDKSNKLIRLTRQMIYEYWKYETDTRNYFLLHIIMSKLIDEDSECRNIFERIPYLNSGNAHVLQGKLGMEYDEEAWGIIRSNSCVHKLTYKNKYLQGDIYNYYTALLADGLY